jgi:hypothetical protein
MARRGAEVARDGVGAREAQGGFKYQRARVTTDDGGEASLCYGGSTGVRTAGAADEPAVCRAHDAVRRRGRRGSRRLGQGERRGMWTSGSTRLGRRERREGACWHPALTVLLALTLNSNFFKFLNKTRPSFEHES